MYWLIYTSLFILGSIIGSFINCLIYRLHIKKSFITGRSFCPQCKTHINWYDNIPLISYLILKATCRRCRKPISFQYFLVELITALLFVIVALITLNSNPLSPYLFLTLLRNLVFTSFLIVIFLYDLKYYLILDKITLPAIAFVLIFNFLLDFIEHGLSHSLYAFLWFLLAAFVAGGFFLIQFLVSRGKWIGGGDIRLGVLMGFMLGWPSVLVALFLTYILGSLVGIYLLITHKKTIKSQVPLGTFLSLATLITLLWGSRLLDWYLGFTF